MLSQTVSQPREEIPVPGRSSVTTKGSRFSLFQRFSFSFATPFETPFENSLSFLLSIDSTPPPLTNATILRDYFIFQNNFCARTFFPRSREMRYFFLSYKFCKSISFRFFLLFRLFVDLSYRIASSSCIFLPVRAADIYIIP